MASTLSSRGVGYAEMSERSMFESIAADAYDRVNNPNGYINMGVAENYAMNQYLADYINSKSITITPEALNYGSGPWGSLRLRTAMAAHITRSFPTHTPISPSHVFFANGATSICDLLGHTLASPHDAILLPQPNYSSFAGDFAAKAQVQCIFVPFGRTDQLAPSCVYAYGTALLAAREKGINVRALLLCNPHNPLGKCYPKATLIALMRFCANEGLHLISDEIYALSTYSVAEDEDEHEHEDERTSPAPFTSVLSFDTAPYIPGTHLHVIYGLSKDFAANGLRLGCLISTNEHLLTACAGIAPFAWSGIGNELIATTILEDEEFLARFFAENRRVLGARSALCRRMVRDYGAKVQGGVNAGLFVWVDMRAWLVQELIDGGAATTETATPSVSAITTNGTNGTADKEHWKWAAEAALATRIMRGAKVLISAGKSLQAEEPGWFRIVFSQVDEDTLKEGLWRVFEIIGPPPGSEA